FPRPAGPPRRRLHERRLDQCGSDHHRLPRIARLGWRAVVRGDLLQPARCRASDGPDPGHGRARPGAGADAMKPWKQAVLIGALGIVGAMAGLGAAMLALGPGAVLGTPAGQWALRHVFGHQATTPDGRAVIGLGEVMPA